MEKNVSVLAGGWNGLGRGREILRMRYVTNSVPVIKARCVVGIGKCAAGWRQEMATASSLETTAGATPAIENEVSDSSFGQSENGWDKREGPTFLSIYQNIDIIPDDETTMWSLHSGLESPPNAMMNCDASLIANEEFIHVVAANSAGGTRILSWGWGWLVLGMVFG